MTENLTHAIVEQLRARAEAAEAERDALRAQLQQRLLRYEQSTNQVRIIECESCATLRAAAERTEAALERECRAALDAAEPAKEAT